MTAIQTTIFMTTNFTNKMITQNGFSQQQKVDHQTSKMSNYVTNSCNNYVIVKLQYVV